MKIINNNIGNLLSKYIVYFDPTGSNMLIELTKNTLISTNRKIEYARKSGCQMVNITIRGHDYVLFFSSGGGESGSPPVLIRPKRYEMILSSIEDNYSRSRMNDSSEKTHYKTKSTLRLHV